MVFDRNILIMEFLGEAERPYPQLRNVELPDPERVYQEIVLFMKTLYIEAELVHADLSEFNILYSDKVHVIDMGQAVTLDHPKARTFLVRDIANVNRYFGSLCPVREEREIFAEITGLSGEGKQVTA
jgi:RIO kinase 1